MNKFAQHRGFQRVYQENKLSLGLIYPIEGYESNIPEKDLQQQISRTKVAEEGKFASLFVRDVPMNDPMFGDAGQMYDPWVFLSHMAAQTENIALGTASAITSFQHPLHLAKSAASFDKISRERLLLGLATGDRPIEFDVFGVDREKRAELFREALQVMRTVWQESHPVIQSENVAMNGETDVLPKPSLGDIPVFVTGRSGQTNEWIAEKSDGWINYPRNLEQQQMLIQNFRSMSDEFKPFTQSLYIDLVEDPQAEPKQIHLGFKCGHPFLIEYLKSLEEIGVNHVILVLKFINRPVDEVLQHLIEEVVPHFPAHL